MRTGTVPATSSDDDELRARCESLEAELSAQVAARDQVRAELAMLRAEQGRLAGQAEGATAFLPQRVGEGVLSSRALVLSSALSIAAFVYLRVASSLFDSPWISVLWGATFVPTLFALPRRAHCRVDADAIVLERAGQAERVRYSELESARVTRWRGFGPELVLKRKRGRAVSLHGVPRVDELAWWITMRIRAEASE